jgi:hypothetical protein
MFKTGMVVKRLPVPDLEGALVQEAQEIAAGQGGAVPEPSDPMPAAPPMGAAPKLHARAAEILATTRF